MAPALLPPPPLTQHPLPTRLPPPHGPLSPAVPPLHTPAPPGPALLPSALTRSLCPTGSRWAPWPLPLPRGEASSQGQLVAGCPHLPPGLLSLDSGLPFTPARRPGYPPHDWGFLPRDLSQPPPSAPCTDISGGLSFPSPSPSTCFIVHPLGGVGQRYWGVLSQRDGGRGVRSKTEGGNRERVLGVWGLGGAESRPPRLQGTEATCLDGGGGPHRGRGAIGDPVSGGAFGELGREAGAE